ncbi:MAG: TonB-dependent receptor [Gammaproteobacteria bacterium]|nr:TonB-dependent receptor [Gammaproteobacteria bacterium]MDE2348280.1 TonB-dependent receptor [Gammaproteobacteria bacterium]
MIGDDFVGLSTAAACVLMCFGSLAAPVPAFAATTASASAGDLEQIVVTAEKRKSTVQKTPISITALSGADLQAQGVTDLVQVAQQVPGVSFKTSGPGQTEFEMRGLTSTGGESPTVGFYLDETALTPPAMAQNGKVVIDPGLFDLNRIEVLRGPQGTLYGAGSMGGTIKLVTNQPDPNRFAASAEAIGSDTSGGGFNHTLNAMLNAPLVAGKAALRLVVTDKFIDGWIDRDVLSPFPLEVNNSTSRGNVAAAPVAARIARSNWERLKGGRAALALTPNDRLKLNLGVLYQRITQGAPNTIDVPPGNEVHYQPFNVSEPFRDAFTLVDLKAQYDFDSFQVVSATSNWERRQGQTQDISEAMQFYIGGFLGPPANFPFSTAAGGLGAGSISEDDDTRQFSEELRVASTGDGPWQWLGGGYYSHFHATSHVYSYYDGFTALFGTNNLADNHRALGVDQYALFGETSYELPDHIKATLGARYFTYHSNSATSVSGVSANGTSATLFGLAANSGVTPKFNLAYIPNDDLTVYATVAKGFRPGGPNSPIPPPCTPAPTQFGPDSVWSYELGEKAKLFDSRVSVNGDVYYENWADVQQQVAPGCGYKYTTNAGKARAYGAELEVAVSPAQGWLLSQNVGYTHATNSTTVPTAGVVAGDRLLDVPQVTASTNLSFRHPLSDSLSFVARATNNYTSSIQDITYTRNTLPAYDLVGARAGVETARWSATLFIDNLTDKKAFLSDTGALSANISILNRVATNQPRTIGADLSVKF